MHLLSLPFRHVHSDNINKYMVKCAGKYRNISFMVPVMREDEPQVWARGSLFRTFPLFDEAFSLPVAIDVPFELNDDRRDLEFADIRNARAFNLQLCAIVFGESKNQFPHSSIKEPIADAYRKVYLRSQKRR